MDNVHTTKKFLVVLIAALGITGAVWAEDTPALNLPVADGPFTPEWESLKQYQCPEWFRDAKFGIWSHWGPQCVPEQGDWYARQMYVEGHRQYLFHCEHFGHPSEVGYKDIIIPDHTPHGAGDTEYGHRGRAYAIGYMKGLMQATGTLE